MRCARRPVSPKLTCPTYILHRNPDNSELPNKNSTHQRERGRACTDDATLVKWPTTQHSPPQTRPLLYYSSKSNENTKTIARWYRSDSFLGGWLMVYADNQQQPIDGRKKTPASSKHKQTKPMRACGAVTAVSSRFLSLLERDLTRPPPLVCSPADYE